jgi:hypothetical protein
LGKNIVDKSTAKAGAVVSECPKSILVPIIDDPNHKRICTSIVELKNLAMRMQIRRLTRLTNGFSKKFENLWAALALYFAWYNFCRVHKTLRVTPAMEDRDRRPRLGCNGTVGVETYGIGRCKRSLQFSRPEWTLPREAKGMVSANGVSRWVYLHRAIMFIGTLLIPPPIVPPPPQLPRADLDLPPDKAPAQPKFILAILDSPDQRSVTIPAD